MKQEEKQLLLKDLCSRLPYKTYVKTVKGIGYVYAINTSQLVELSVANDFEYWSEVFNINEIKPYLRPMLDITEEEKCEFNSYYNMFNNNPVGLIDWLNAHYFDYHNLIEKNLALEAPSGMYKKGE